jgi:hypothetical protein
MKQWAIIYKNEVVNRIIWSGESNWKYPFAHDEMIEDNTGIYKIGMVRINNVWTMPEVTEEPKTPDIQMVVHDLGEALKPYLKANELTAETLYMFSVLYIEWEAGQTITADTIRSYKGKIYEVINAHTPHVTQIGWEPDKTPALWKVFTPAGVIAAWKQPAGAQDAYQIGDKVTYNGFTWQSTAANNVWAPGVYGWVKI